MRRAILLATLLAGATAQGKQKGPPSLTDDEVARALPLLRLEVDALRRMRAEAEQIERSKARVPVIGEAAVEISMGRMDALEWMQQQTRRAVAPEGARYDAECSRASSKQEPTAVFTFGLEASRRRQRVLRESKDADSPETVALLLKTRDPSTESVVKRAAEFFAAAGLSWSHDDLRHVFREPEGSLVAEVHEVAPARFADCGLPSGPILLLRAGPKPKPGETAVAAARRLAREDDMFQTALRESALGRGGYEDIKLRLLLARRAARAHSCAGPAAPAHDAGRDTALERQVQADCQFYRRRRDELEPVLAEMAKAIADA